MSASKLPVLVLPAHPFCPIEQWRTMLPESLSECCEPRIWSWNPPSRKGLSPGALRQLSVHEFQIFLKGLPEGFFVFAEGLSGLFFLEAMLSSGLSPGGLIWMSPHLAPPIPSIRLRVLRLFPWILPLWNRLDKNARIFRRAQKKGSSKNSGSAKYFFLLQRGSRKSKKKNYTFSEQVLWLCMLMQSPRLESLKQNPFAVLLLSGDRSKKQDRLIAECLNQDLPHSELIRFAHLGPAPFWEETELCMHFINKFIQENKVEKHAHFPFFARNKSSRITLR